MRPTAPAGGLLLGWVLLGALLAAAMTTEALKIHRRRHTDPERPAGNWSNPYLSVLPTLQIVSLHTFVVVAAAASVVFLWNVGR